MNKEVNSKTEYNNLVSEKMEGSETGRAANPGAVQIEPDTGGNPTPKPKGEKEQENASGSEAEAESQQIEEIDIDCIDHFLNHPYKIGGPHERSFKELSDSIVENGMLTPIILRRKEESRLEVISGHRRLEIFKRQGKKKIKSIVLDLDDDQARNAVIAYNLHRKDLLPSEMGGILQWKMDALRSRQGENTESTPEEDEESGKTIRKKAANIMGINDTAAQRYLRINELVEELKELVDEKRISLSVAAILSHLNKDAQNMLASYFTDNCKGKRKLIVMEQATTLKDKRVITKEDIESVFNSPLKTQKSKKRKVSLSEDIISKYLGKGLTTEQIGEKLEDMLKKMKPEQNMIVNVKE